MKSAAAGFVAALAALGAAACAPVSESHGWVADSGSAIDVQPGVDTRSTVLARMGSPSTVSPYGTPDWYYITTLQQSYAYFTPKTIARSVMVVRFNPDDVVASVDRYGLEKGRVVALTKEATPTRGRELGFLEQVFGTLGSTSPIRTEDEDEQNRRNRR